MVRSPGEPDRGGTCPGSMHRRMAFALTISRVCVSGGDCDVLSISGGCDVVSVFGGDCDVVSVSGSGCDVLWTAPTRHHSHYQIHLRERRRGVLNSYFI